MIKTKTKKPHLVAVVIVVLFGADRAMLGYPLQKVFLALQARQPSQ
jgi:hypothetical protein